MTLHSIMTRYHPAISPRLAREFLREGSQLRDWLLEGQLLDDARSKTIRRAGMYSSSRAFSTLSSRQAYRQLRSLVPAPSYQLDDAYLTTAAELEQFGRHIIAAAKDSLPVEVLMIAEQIRRSSDYSQREDLISRAYELLKPDVWDSRHPILSLERVRARRQQDEPHLDHDYSPWACLPHVFGRFPDSGMIPCCLGMGILCASFCEAAGLRYMFSWVTESDKDYSWRRMAQQMRQVLGFCEARGLELPVGLLGSIRQLLREAEQRNPDRQVSATGDPHVCIFLQVMADSEWVGFDPWMDKLFYLDDVGYGRFGEHDVVSLDSAYALLERHAAVFPGLTIQLRHREIDECWKELDLDLSMAFQMVDVMLADREKIFATSRLNPETDIIDLVVLMGKALVQLQDLGDYTDMGLNLLMEKRSTSKRWSPQKLAAHAILSELISSYRLPNKAVIPDEEARIRSSVTELYGKDPYMTERVQRDAFVSPIVHEFRSSYYSFLEFTEPATQWKFPHAALEFGRPSMQIACGVLMHLYAWDEWTRQRMTPADLLPYTSSQVIAHEVISDLHYRSTELDDDNDFRIVVAHEGEPAPREINTQTFAGWLTDAGQVDGATLEWPSALFLEPDVQERVREAWHHLNRLPPVLRHALVRRLIERLTAQAKQPNSTRIIQTERVSADG